MKRLLISFSFLSFVFASVQAQPKTIQVPQDRPTVQAGVNAASNGDTVLVSDGTYTENIVVTKKIVVGSLYLINKYTSRISKTILNGGSPRHGDSASVVTIDGATDTTTLVVGFTIKAGKGNLRVTSIPVTLTYRVGTGIDIAGGGATIRKNTIVANNLTTSGRISGVVNVWDVADVNGVSLAVVEDNNITDNTLVGTSVEGCALGIGHSARVMRSRIVRNVATGTSAGLGAAAQIWNGTVRFENNLISNNSASHWGGALFVNPYGSVVPGTSMALTLVNNIIANNSAGVGGGALWVEVAQATVLSINNTIVGNTSPAGAGLYVKDNASFKAVNTILWNTGGPEISLVTGGSVVAAYSNVRNGLAGTGNINSDPLFVSSHQDSLGWFRYNSPCRDAGSDTATVGGVLLTAPAKDYYGHGRAKPDIGAFEDGPWSGVEDVSDGIPTGFELEQNFPNPFNPSTMIRFSLPRAGNVRIDIYNLLGQKVEELVNERLEAGIKQVAWTAEVPSGVYLYRISVSTVDGQRYEQAKRMVLIK